jgi:hypothetical protein
MMNDEFFHSGSRIRNTELTKNLCIFLYTYCYEALRNMIRDVYPRSRIPDPDSFHPGSRNTDLDIAVCQEQCV